MIGATTSSSAAPTNVAGPFDVDFSDSDQIGLTAGGGVVRLDWSLGDLAAYAPFQHAGILITRPLDTGMPVAAAFTRLTAEVPEGSALELEIRGSTNGIEWTSWYPPSGDSGVIFPWPVRFLQHRLTLLGDAQSPEVQALEVVVQPGVPQMQALQSRNNPTVKVFASREGLVGRTTANGHKIEATDRFVALPSRKVLNPRGKDDYKVRISYQGRTVEAPVWDVGPWNTRDNYWDQDREMFKDLPRFLPQAFAAWADNHNGGRDGSGRWVSFPASLDISDALFVDELKMRTSSWVEATFLWVDAASPPPGRTPPVTGLKPQESKGMQPTPNPESIPTKVAPTRTPEKSTATPTQQRSTPTSTPQPATPTLAPTAELPETPAEPANQPDTAAAESVPPPPQISSDASAQLRATSLESMRPNVLHVTRVPAGDGFTSRIALMNPSDRPVQATLQFIRPDGGRESRDVAVPEQGRAVFSVDDHVPGGDYSVQIESDRPILAERTVLFGDDGATHAATSDASLLWFFPEGSSESPSETFLALRNVSGAEARAALTFINDGGRVGVGEVRLASGARAIVNLAELVPSIPASTIVESDQPIVAERLTLRNGNRGGDGGIGATKAASSWYFADARTADGVDAWLILLNPSAADAIVSARMFGDQGLIGEREYRVPAGTRRPIHLNDDMPGARFATVLNADQPIVAERTEFVGDSPRPDGMSSMIGSTEPGGTWLFPEGFAGESIVVFNASDRDGQVNVEVFAERGRMSSRQLRLGPQGRATLDISAESQGVAVSVRLSADVGIVAEREIRLSDGRGETAALGIRQ